MRFKLNNWVSALAIVGLLIGCGDSNSTGSGSATVSDQPGANTPITSSNAQQAMVEASAALNGAMGRILAAAAAKQAVATKSVSNQTINGLASGSVTIKSGDFDVSSSGQTLKADVEFNDFSDDGQLFIGGPVNMEIVSSIGTIDPNNPTASLGSLSFSFKQKGDLAFAGKYKGTLSMDIDVSLSNGIPTVKGSVTVDGNRISF
ncbi:MAG: hypothetical protein HOE48_10260 [Candidatus Latescibacteria bacterium]|jgi:hypothetical protein|nr:hypothetical protein [Candidatus Latescibacterota bacterium]MBT4138291.1 hypothetical protein [Candidatus Latescibacterota bacterium]